MFLSRPCARLHKSAETTEHVVSIIDFLLGLGFIIIIIIIIIVIIVTIIIQRVQERPSTCAYIWQHRYTHVGL